MDPLANNNEVVSRAEFDSHRQQVSKDIEGLANAIHAESSARSRDTQLIRTDIKEITSVTGRPQYQALGFAFGIFSFIILILGAVYAHGDTQVRAAGLARMDQAEHDLEAIAGRVTEHQRDGHPRSVLIQIENLDERMQKSIADTEAALYALKQTELQNAAFEASSQERLTALERLVFPENE